MKDLKKEIDLVRLEIKEVRSKIIEHKVAVNSLDRVEKELVDKVLVLQRKLANEISS